jgi:alpha-glucosidase (family GH31 glycosyl hydrolase)
VLEASGNGTASAVWRPGAEDTANLGGTISSWNEVSPENLLSGDSSYQPGPLSAAGWAIVDDSVTPLLSFEQPELWQGQAPWYKARPASSSGDLSFFGCARRFRSCLRDFTALAGPVPMPPLATFGVWWSHYETYSEGTIVDTVRTIVGLYPIVTFQYSATTLYQVSYHIQHLFF